MRIKAAAIATGSMLGLGGFFWALAQWPAWIIIGAAVGGSWYYIYYHILQDLKELE